MRQRMRKKMVERQSLFNIHLAQFTAELNRTVEDAYRTLDAVLAEVDGPARIRWQRVIALPDVPVTRHAKVNVKASPVVELEQLMLAAPGDRRDPRPAQGPQPVRRDATLERRVDERHAIDDLPDGRLPQDTSSAFDFR